LRDLHGPLVTPQLFFLEEICESNQDAYPGEEHDIVIHRGLMLDAELGNEAQQYDERRDTEKCPGGR
jgi:hypothetical protein